MELQSLFGDTETGKMVAQPQGMLSGRHPSPQHNPYQTGTSGTDNIIIGIERMKQGAANVMSRPCLANSAADHKKLEKVLQSRSVIGKNNPLLPLHTRIEMEKAMANGMSK